MNLYLDLLIVILLSTTSCGLRQGQEKTSGGIMDSTYSASMNDSDTLCDQNLMAVNSIEEVSAILEPVINSKDFYNPSIGEFYVFEIFVDNSLLVRDVQVVHHSGTVVEKQFIEVLKNLEYRLISNDIECSLFSMRFVVQCRSKLISYPNSTDFYDQLNIEE